MKISWKLFGTTLFLILLVTILPFKIPQFEDIESRAPTVLELIRSTKSIEKELEFVDKKVKKNVLLVAYWRTGSTYFGQLLGHYPKTYYSYEPIHTFSNRKNQWGNYSQEQAIKLIQDIFQCKFYSKDAVAYLEHAKDRPRLLRQAKYIYDSCHNHIGSCRHPYFHTALCSNSNINLIKTVRLRTSSLDTLLMTNPNLQIILLVRDPRAVMNSRWSNWCGNKPKCKVISQYCTELKEDVIHTLHLAKRFPGKLRIVRYEDLIHNKSQVLTQAYHTLGLTDMTFEKVASFFNKFKFINPRVLSAMAKSGEYSYRRHSNLIPKKWLTKLSESVVEGIQRQCTKPMNLLGYPTRQEIIASGELVIQPESEIESILIK